MDDPSRKIELSVLDPNNILWKVIDGQSIGKRVVYNFDSKACWLEETTPDKVKKWIHGPDADYNEIFVVANDKTRKWAERIKEIVNHNDEGNLLLIAKMIEESERAKQTLRDKGYGWTGLSLLETVVKLVPESI